MTRAQNWAVLTGTAAVIALLAISIAVGMSTALGVGLALAALVAAGVVGYVAISYARSRRL